jgi:HEAT repeat protein
MLSEENPSIQAVIDCGIVPRLLEFLTYSHNETLQYNAAWTITNIASGTTDHTKHIVKLGSIQYFVQLLGSSNAEVREQAVWALGNIAGDSPEFRDLVLNTGGSVQRLLYILDPAQKPKITMVRNATWCVSNFCRGKPRPNFQQILPVIPTLAKLLMNSDNEVLTDSCWALSYITDDQTEDNAKIGAVVSCEGVCARLVHLLQHGPQAVQVPALRTIGNIVTGDDKQTQAMLNCKPLPALLGTLSRQKKSLRKETCWTLSNITAGTANQIELLINANLIPPLVAILRESEFDVQKEAAWAISNITSGGTDAQIRYLVTQAAIPSLCGMLSCDDPKIVLVCLEGIDNVLKIGKKDNETDNKYADFVEECGGLDKLEELQRHENEQIYEKSVHLLKEYFEGDEEETDMAPAVDATNNQFAFGMAQNAAATPQFAF